MSRGTPRVAVRIPPSLRATVEVVIAHRNANSRQEPWDLSDFIKIALQEKLAKMARCRGRKIEPTLGDVLNTLRPLPHQRPTLFDGIE